jgi:hypothetical protein
MLAYALTVLLHIFALKISGISSIKLEKNEKRKTKKKEFIYGK